MGHNNGEDKLKEAEQTGTHGMDTTLAEGGRTNKDTNGMDTTLAEGDRTNRDTQDGHNTS